MKTEVLTEGKLLDKIKSALEKRKIEIQAKIADKMNKKPDEKKRNLYNEAIVEIIKYLYNSEYDSYKKFAEEKYEEKDFRFPMLQDAGMSNMVDKVQSFIKECDGGKYKDVLISKSTIIELVTWDCFFCYMMNEMKSGWDDFCEGVIKKELDSCKLLYSFLSDVGALKALNLNINLDKFDSTYDPKSYFKYNTHPKAGMETRSGKKFEGFDNANNYDDDFDWDTDVNDSSESLITEGKCAFTYHQFSGVSCKDGFFMNAKDWGDMMLKGLPKEPTKYLDANEHSSNEACIALDGGADWEEDVDGIHYPIFPQDEIAMQCFHDNFGHNELTHCVELTVDNNFEDRIILYY